MKASKSNAESDEKSELLENKGKNELTKTYKILRIVTLFLLWICFGAFSEITGPVMPELIAQTSSGYEIIAQSISMRGAGHALGGVIGGLTVDRWFRHIDVCVAVVLVGYTIIGVAAAYVQSVPILFFVFFIQGSVETWLQTAGYRIAFKTWKEKSAGPLHALHMGYGIGSIIVPQLVTPFLDPRFSGGAVVTGFDSPCRMNDSQSDVSTTTLLMLGALKPDYPANFVNAYWILAVVSLSIAGLFMGYHIHSRVTGVSLDDSSERKSDQTKASFKESVALTSCSPIHPNYAGALIACLFAYYVVSVPLVRAFSKFIFSYARDGPCLSVEDSTSLESAYFAALTVGRLCAFLCSSLLHMKYILQVEVIGVLVATAVLFFFNTNITVLWIFCSALGFFTGPIIPSAFAWANRYIEVTSTAQIIPQVGAAVGDVAFLMVVGYSYQTYGPHVLWSYQFILGGAICTVAWVMQVFGSLHGDRFKYIQN